MRPCPRAALPVAALAAALLSAAPPSLAEDGPPIHFVSVLGELNDDGGGAASASVDLGLGPATRLDASVGYASALDENGVDTTRVGLGLAREGERYRARLGAFWWEDPDVLEATGAEASLRLRRERLWFEVDGEWRRNDFASFDADTLVRLRDREILVRARASCSVDGGGLGVRLGLDAGPWSLHVGGMDYAWEDADCAFDAPGLERLARTGRDGFAQLAAGLTDRLANTALGWVNRNAALLDHQWEAGVGRHVGPARVGLDLQRARERFLGEDFDVVSLSVGMELGLRTFLDGYVGWSMGADQEVGFAGLMWTRAF